MSSGIHGLCVLTETFLGRALVGHGDCWTEIAAQVFYLGKKKNQITVIVLIDISL